MKKKLILAFTILLPGFLTCSGSTFKPNTVYRDWTSRMSELGIYPVFPPREDVSVGDIYLLPMHPYQTKLVSYVGGLGTAGMRVGFLDGTKGILDNTTCTNGDQVITCTNAKSLADLLTDEFKKHPSWVATPAAGTNSTDALPFISVPQLTNANASQDTRSNIFAALTPNRLKEVAFPEFSVTVADAGSLSALVPVEAFLVNAGFNFSQVSSVSVKISQAESYGIPIKDLALPFLKKYVMAGVDKDNKTNNYLLANNPYVDEGSASLARSMFNESLQLSLKNNISWWHWYDRHDLLSQLKKDENYLYFGLVTEVYYARSMDISVNSTKGFGVGAGVRPAGPDDLLKLAQLGLISSSSVSTNSSSGNGTNLTFISTIQTNSIDLQTATNAIALAMQLKNSNYGQNTIGGSLQVVGASSYNIGLRRTFQYPVAVGVRGVILRFNCKAETFTVLNSTNAEKQTGFKISTYPEQANP